MFFMREVAMTNRKWDVDDFLTKLFDHCFPPNFRTGQRVKLTECRQSGRSVRDWVFELQGLADSVGDVPDCQLVLYFWQGSDNYIRKKWAEAGYSPEVSDFDELELAAERYQEAARYEQYDSRQMFSERNSHDRQRSGGCYDSRRHARFGEYPGDLNKGPSSSTAETKSGKMEPTKAAENQKPSGSTGKALDASRPRNPNENRRRLPQKELDELRAQNKCFECRQEGHLSKDCPRRKRVNRRAGDSLTVGAISMTTICVSKDDAMALGFHSIPVILEDATEMRTREVEAAIALLDLQENHTQLSIIEDLPVDAWSRNPEFMQAMDDVLISRCIAQLWSQVPYVYDFLRCRKSFRLQFQKISRCHRYEVRAGT